jgi:hypothetical protein
VRVITGLSARVGLNMAEAGDNGGSPENKTETEAIER